MIAFNSSPRILERVAALPRYATATAAPSAEMVYLASNESPFEPLPSVRQAVIAGSARLNRYPEMHSGALRGVLAERLGVAPDRVVVGTGSAGILQQVFAAFAQEGDSVVYPWRSFEAYPILIGASGATGVAVPLGARGELDLAGMRAAIDTSTKAVLLCLPNNPTGTIPSRSEVAEFVAAVPGHVLVVIDEAYLEFVGPGSGVDALRLLTRHDNVCVVRTFSKAYGLAGLRIGYAVSSSRIADALRRVFLPFGVTALAQAAACASLDARSELDARVDAIVRERERVSLALRGHGWPVPESHANFVWLAVPETAEAVGEALRDRGVIARVFPGDGVRLTIGTPEMNDHALAALTEMRER
ncbi:histidinol-phosphate transaminase [Streptosporangium fragile]|uniref:Histidinol-phosphate aminotransferase n=2 Tax=Streptosporangium fragile TaxID=46186 RepID=A0ABP6IK64_9ACTN